MPSAHTLRLHGIKVLKLAGGAARAWLASRVLRAEWPLHVDPIAISEGSKTSWHDSVEFGMESKCPEILQRALIR